MRDLVGRIVKWITGLLHINLFYLDDLLFIIRPAVYVGQLMIHGRKSYVPIKTALYLDITAILLSIYRLYKSANSKKKGPAGERLSRIERQQIVKRIYEALLKYLIRDPIFDAYTKVYMGKVFTALHISPRLLNFLISIIHYFRYQQKY